MVSSATAGRAQVVALERRRGGVDAEPRQQPDHRVEQRAEDHRRHGHGTDDGGREDHPVGGHALELAVRRHGQAQPGEQADGHHQDDEEQGGDEALGELGSR